ncbi:MAG: hypothetical protein K1Y36_26550 [Blastocatellia bacterium]|nr:hypothetical protein [Blastocatellia bacterium]
MFLIATMWISNLAQNPTRLDQTATSSVETSQDEDGQWVITTTNRTFEFINILPPPLSEPLCLRREVKRRYHVWQESGESIIKVEGWKGVNPAKKIWTFEQEGSEGSVWNEFYRVTMPGCCANLTTHSFYNLQTGRKVYSATADPVTIVAPEPGVYRYVAYHSNDGILPALKPYNQELKGVIQYGTEKTVLTKLAVYAKRDLFGQIKFRYQNKVVETKDLQLEKVAGKKGKASLSNFAIILWFSSTDEIVLPVMNDTIEVSQASVPFGIRLEVVK